jgi:hypothetical protein
MYVGVYSQSRQVCCCHLNPALNLGSSHHAHASSAIAGVMPASVIVFRDMPRSIEREGCQASSARAPLICAARTCKDSCKSSPQPCPEFYLYMFFAHVKEMFYHSPFSSEPFAQTCDDQVG